MLVVSLAQWMVIWLQIYCRGEHNLFLAICVRMRYLEIQKKLLGCLLCVLVRVGVLEVEGCWMCVGITI